MTENRGPEQSPEPTIESLTTVGDQLNIPEDEQSSTLLPLTMSKAFLLVQVWLQKEPSDLMSPVTLWSVALSKVQSQKAKPPISGSLASNHKELKLIPLLPSPSAPSAPMKLSSTKTQTELSWKSKPLPSQQPKLINLIYPLPLKLSPIPPHLYLPLCLASTKLR